MNGLYRFVRLGSTALTQLKICSPLQLNRGKTVESRQKSRVSFWRQVDATVGQWTAIYRNIWRANDLSDGCFVEFRLTD